MVLLASAVTGLNKTNNFDILGPGPGLLLLVHFDLLLQFSVSQTLGAWGASTNKTEKSSLILKNNANFNLKIGFLGITCGSRSSG